MSLDWYTEIICTIHYCANNNKSPTVTPPTKKQIEAATWMYEQSFYAIICYIV